MALDVGKLRAGLENYRETLEKQRKAMDSEYRSLQGRFNALFAVYGGSTAEEFRHNWNKTSSWFEAYLKNTAILDGFLKERIEHLRKM